MPGTASSTLAPPVPLVGDDLEVECVDGTRRRAIGLDAAASTAALPAVATSVGDFLPWYSSVHRGAGQKSQVATAAYEAARAAALGFAGRTGAGDDVAILCRNTTEAINLLSHRLRLEPGETVVTTVAEHHANLLPWARACRRQYVEVAADGTFGVDDVRAAFDELPGRPRLLAVTAASNVTGWMPPLDELIALAHDRGVPVLVDGAQLAAHRALPAGADFVAWSGHKMYAPYGAGVLVGPSSAFREGDPMLAGGGAVDLVTLDEVIWTAPPESEEAGSPNLLGAVALAAAINELGRIGWGPISAHDHDLASRLRDGLAAIAGVRLLGPATGSDTLPLATFSVAGVPHALVAARLAAEWGIAVRHGCFCAHPYLERLLGLGAAEVEVLRRAVRAGDRRAIPGAVRASAGINTRAEDVDALLGAVEVIASGVDPPVDYVQDPSTGDFSPLERPAGWPELPSAGSACSRS